MIDLLRTWNTPGKWKAVREALQACPVSTEGYCGNIKKWIFHEAIFSGIIKTILLVPSESIHRKSRKKAIRQMKSYKSWEPHRKRVFFQFRVINFNVTLAYLFIWAFRFLRLIGIVREFCQAEDWKGLWARGLKRICEVWLG